MGTITASCGHQVQSIADLVPVQFEDEEWVPIDGYVPVTVYADYCAECAGRLALQGAQDGKA